MQEKNELPNLWVASTADGRPIARTNTVRKRIPGELLYIPAERIREILRMDVGIWDCKCGCGKQQMIERLIGIEKETT